MDSKEGSQNNLNNISTEDILESLESFGNRSNSPEQDRAKASNRDSGVSESCSSYFSDPLSAANDGQSVLSDNERQSFTSDTSVISDPLGVYGSSDEGDNEIHYFSTEPWDEKQSLEKEWNVLFSSKNFLQELRHHALNGKLKLSKYRSIAWKLFLDCLPEDQGEWITKTKQLRQEYDLFKQKSLIDPNQSKDDDSSMHILHPLSLEEKSPWKQYFDDNELKSVIIQDLDRLYPEMEFFHSSSIKEMMLNLLFCYVKKNESLGYKQGMHELLAPIVYVLDKDSKAQRYMEGDILEISRCLLDPAFVEHDAFFMFSQLMEVTEVWYQQRQSAVMSTNDKFIGQHASEPFTNPLASPPTAIVKKLNKIQDHLLRKYDPDLWIHMKELNIVPQVYGLRWIRLLFSREFPFQDVLVIWDALFAEGSHLDLVDYIYIVMLQTIRNKLIAGNYVTCMGHLMKFPRVCNDVYVYVKRALNLRGEKNKNQKPRQPSRSTPRPSSPPAKKGFLRKHTEQVTSMPGKQMPGKQMPGKQMPGKQMPGKQMPKKASQRRPPTTFSTLTKRYTPFMDPIRHRSLANKGDQTEQKTTELVHKSPRTPLNDSLSPTTRDRTDSTSSIGSNSGRNVKSLGSDLKTKFTRPRSLSRQSVEELEKDHQRLQTQVSQLNNNVERMQGLYLYCGRKLDSYIGLIQEEITKDDEADQDVVFLSLAGLKQVRDLLKGTLTYRGTTSETQKDFVDIDNGIATRLQLALPNVFPRSTASDNTPVPSLANFNHYDNSDIKETAFPVMHMSTDDTSKVDNNGVVGLCDNDSENKSKRGCAQNVEHDRAGSEDVCHDEAQGEEERSSKPVEDNLNMACNPKNNSTEQITRLENSKAQELLETKEDHFDVQGNNESGAAESKRENVTQNSKVLSLDSYLKEHFSVDSECKEPIKIAAVPCATGPEVTIGNNANILDPCSNPPLFGIENHGYSNDNKDIQHEPGQNKVNNRFEATKELIKRNQKNYLKFGETNTDNMLGESPAPDEPLDGFVFVNPDGTARSEDSSPARRLSPTNPLQTNEDDDRFV